MFSYVRFETCLPADTARRPVGIFHAACDLDEWTELPDWIQQEIDDSFVHFSRRLPSPRDVDARAVFWFDARTDLIGEIWTLVAAVREAGLPVQKHSTSRPGRIVYRDRHQVAAIPFRSRRRRR